ncbi:hypothetical protein [Bacillus litorisediminis]|uniref:hypothetical protein n=1 Tax=Bacillus litorisediminis TaxID=2922713 RepID=UPI001FB004B5|nr:hypothetical protein [Bacillus litorisediminis]
MLVIQEEVKKVFVVFAEWGWTITDDENEAAKIDPSYRQANIEELNMLIACNGTIFNEVIESADGLVRWVFESVEDELGFEDVITCEYQLI